ncbi:Membrane-bound lytic murein transglycosylase D precursor [Pseudoalteromonas luteoviolacea B = ATCC 29581]|nr:Membrane-bound lytic murein transglycosylase D precursor [Pseudoalteromonas luteoviolacea B = ATCC 29581]
MSQLKCLVLLISFSMLGACTTLPLPSDAPEEQQVNHFAQVSPSKITAPAHAKKTPIKTAKKTESKSSKSNNTKKSAPKNLWQDIANHLNFNSQPHPRLQKRINWYLKQPNYLLSANKRATPFLFHIVQKVRKQGLPLELALLPFVESDFRLTARSSEHALGIWQLMPATAHHFGVTQNEWYDGRLDVLKATDAALAYLKYLHGRFDGDWLHAIAAYNSGEGKVFDAIEANRKIGKSTHFWHLSLPKETAEYVPKLLALSHLLKTQPKRFEIPMLANRPLSTALDIGQPFDFSVIAKLSRIDKELLHKLNKGYLRHRSPPTGPHVLLLPFSEEALVHKPFFANHFTLKYRVKRGDTLYRIANRYGMSLSALRSLNQKKDDFLRVGQIIKVSKTKAKMDLLVDYEISPFVVKREKPKVPLVEYQHTVSQGESLWSISQKYQVSLRNLTAWNKLGKRTLLKLGQVLTILRPQHHGEDNEINERDPLVDLELRLKQNSQR